MSKDLNTQTQQKSRPNGEGNGAEPRKAKEAFDPIIPMVLSMDAWGRLAQDQVARVQALYDELAGFESAAYERAKQAGNDLAEMMNETVTYWTRLAAEWRNLSLEATRRGAELFGARS